MFPPAREIWAAKENNTNTKMSHRTESQLKCWISQHNSLVCGIRFYSSAPSAEIRLSSFLYSNKQLTICSDWSSSTMNAIYVSGTIYTFWNTLAAHVFCNYSSIQCNMGERLLHWREEQYTGREPAVPEFQVQLFRLKYKWLFFCLEHVKSKFLPNSFQQLWIHSL